MAVLLSEKKTVVSRAWPMCSGPLAAEKKLKRCLERPREPLDVCGTLNETEFYFRPKHSSEVLELSLKTLSTRQPLCGKAVSNCFGIGGLIQLDSINVMAVEEFRPIRSGRNIAVSLKCAGASASFNWRLIDVHSVSLQLCPSD